MSVLLTTPEIKRALKPPSKWFNWWRMLGRSIAIQPDGTEVDLPAGSTWLSQQCWPSKEIAEQRAADELAFDNKYAYVVYLGALPEGMRPDV